MTGFEIKGLLGAILIAFGVAAPLPDFLAGMALALGGAFFAMMGTAPSSRASYATTIFLAIMAGLAAALLHPLLYPPFLRDWPVQLIMMLAGAMSKYLAESVVTVGQGFRDRSGEIVRNAKLPWFKAKGDGDV